MIFLSFLLIILSVLIQGCMVCNNIEWQNDYSYLHVKDSVDAIVPIINFSRQQKNIFIPPFIINRYENQYGLNFDLRTQNRNIRTLDSIYYNLKSNNDSTLHKQYVKCGSEFWQNSDQESAYAFLNFNTEYNIAIKDKTSDYKVDIILYLHTNDQIKIEKEFLNLDLKRLKCTGIYLFSF